MRSGLIIEGVVGSGKTTLLSAIQRRLADEFPSCTKFFVSEHYTDRIFEDGRHVGVIDMHAVLQHTAEIVGIVTRLAAVKSASKFANVGANAAAPVFLERWIGSHVAHVRARGQAEPSCIQPEIKRQYDALLQMNLGVLLLHVDPAEMERRLTQTLTHRNAGWHDYVMGLGGIYPAARFFATWQDHLLRFYAELEIEPEIVTAVGPDSVCTVAEQIVNEVMAVQLAV